MTTVSIEYIVLDDKGSVRIAGSRSKVAQVVCDVRNGMSPEMIRDAYPHLSLSRIYAALSYYHDHQVAVDAQIREGERFADALRANAEPSPTRAELAERLRLAQGSSRDSQ